MDRKIAIVSFCLLLQGQLAAQKDLELEQNQNIIDAIQLIKKIDSGNYIFSDYLDAVKACEKVVAVVPKGEEVFLCYDRLRVYYLVLARKFYEQDSKLYEKCIDHYKMYIRTGKDLSHFKDDHEVQSHLLAVSLIEKEYEACVQWVKIRGSSDLNDYTPFLKSYTEIKYYCDLVKEDKNYQQCMFEAFRDHPSIQGGEAFLSSVSNRIYHQEVKSMLDSLYLQEGKNAESISDLKEALRIYAKLDSLDGYQNDQFKQKIGLLQRKLKRKSYLSSIDNLLVYFFTMEPAVCPGKSTGLSGISVNRYRSEKTGYYFSMKANPHFFVPKQNMKDLTENDFTLEQQDREKISSAEVSVGLIKNIYSPVYLSAGVGFGLNTLSKKYAITDNQSSQPHSYWLYEGKYRNIFLSPEIGIHLVTKIASVSFNYKYISAIKNKENPSLKKNSYSVGVGMPIEGRRHSGFLGRRDLFLAYTFDFPNPHYLSFGRNSCLYGLSIGSLNGIYCSFRVNQIYFMDQEDYENKYEKGNLFASVGYGNSLFFHLVHFYAGAGILKQKGWLDRDTDLFTSKLRFSPEAGINLVISNLILRGGVSIPELSFKHDNLYFSGGIGYIW
jgi:hypothetical protein